MDEAAYKKYREAYATLYGMNSFSINDDTIIKAFNALYDAIVGLGAIPCDKAEWVRRNYAAYTGKCKFCGDAGRKLDKHGYCQACINGMARTRGD